MDIDLPLTLVQRQLQGSTILAVYPICPSRVLGLRATNHDRSDYTQQS